MAFEDSQVELVLGSRTQTPEAVQDVLNDLGYESTDVETQSDAPEAAAPPVETAEPTDSSVPSTDAGGETAGVEEGENKEADSETVQTQEIRPPAAKPKSGFKKKIGKLESEIEDLKRQLADRTAVKPAEDPLPEISAEPAPEPMLEDLDDNGEPKYASYEEFNKALSKWAYQEEKRQDVLKVKTARETKVTEAAAEKERTEREAAATRWNEQVEVGKSKYDDFEEVLKKAPEMPAAIPLTEALRDSDMSAELVYHLATHRDELDRLNQLLDLPQNSPALEFRRKLRIAHREIDKLEALVSKAESTEDAANGSGASKEEPQRTDAARESRGPAAPTPAPANAAPPKKKPEPIKPVGSRGGSLKKRLQDMTSDEVHALDPDELRKLVEAA